MCAQVTDVKVPLALATDENLRVLEGLELGLGLGWERGGVQEGRASCLVGGVGSKVQGPEWRVEGGV